MLIGAFVIFFSLHEPFEASFYEITFGLRPLREKETAFGSVLKRGGLSREVAALYGKFKTACMLQIPLVAEFGTDHIEKATIITMQNKKWTIQIWHALIKVILKFGKIHNIRHIREELIPLSSSSWGKRKFENVFLTVRFKKLKPMAIPGTGLFTEIKKTANLNVN